MEAIRAEFPWLTGGRGERLLVTGDGETAWWTFAGGRANAALAHELARRTGREVTSDNFAVRFPPGFERRHRAQVLEAWRRPTREVSWPRRASRPSTG